MLQKVDPAYLEFSVTASLVIEPDGAFLLEGGTAQLKLFEKSGILNEQGKPTLRGKIYKTVLTCIANMFFFDVQNSKQRVKIEITLLKSKNPNMSQLTVSQIM